MRKLFAVMKAYPIEAIKVRTDKGWEPCHPDEAQPPWYIPAFETYEAAKEWAGEGAMIAEMKEDRGDGA